MNLSGLFVFKVPGQDEWVAYDGRVSEEQPEVMLPSRCSPWSSNTVCRIPIELGRFDTEADAWLCVNELQRKEKNNG